MKVSICILKGIWKILSRLLLFPLFLLCAFLMLFAETGCKDGEAIWDASLLGRFMDWY